MSRITQFSTIGALMAGHFRGETTLGALCCGHEAAFGLGCSAQINGELTIWQGRVHEATAGEALHDLPAQEAVPFVQMTAFAPQAQHEVSAITQDNAGDWLSRFTTPDNIFLAVCIEGIFDHLVLRRPHRAAEQESGETRSVDAVAASQQVTPYTAITGRLVGFWTPALFGRVSVPGFHFHFLDEAETISGHVLEFSAAKAVLSFEEKPTIEITNPQSAAFRSLAIDLETLDDMIHRIEK